MRCSFLIRAFIPNQILTSTLILVMFMRRWSGSSLSGINSKPTRIKPRMRIGVMKFQLSGMVQRGESTETIMETHRSIFKSHGVYTFNQIVAMHGEDVELKVQIIETKCNPIETITHFHSTCVINIIIFDAAYSFYLIATFEERSAMQIPGSNRLDAIAKYVGWSMQCSGQRMTCVPYIHNDFF
ncbi:hypothetical protein DFH29DRAFT_904567 [Suillus ampliporus]|nr:hypothetical protein DFH29DRAFT_904567 [Suillus ampliporus]